MPELATNYSVLKKRLSRLLFHNRRRDKAELNTSILPVLSEVGRLALVGGAIRDVALSGGDKFRSDLDFVVFDGDLQAFYGLMKSLKANPNRFGGYSLRFSRWKIDVWALEDTWARTAGLRSVEHVSDLLNCTFFNWDAAVFVLDEQTLHTRHDYLYVLRKGLLETNLVENPNPKGSLVRALRRARLWNAYFGPELTEFTMREMPKHSWAELLETEARAFRNSVLQSFDYQQLLDNLERHLVVDSIRVTRPFGTDPQQLELF